ncbi:M48 family metalloprotease [Stieleria varia]|uniref:Protease HtpX n=1 Tax=Stieleria varia TaxID=2528005 RepID=A0A5C5ZY24_9BACT|nr:M48 family metalloprotease [Stieleria varia]TWT92060.1 Protease HtpX [Stieleria varia]
MQLFYFLLVMLSLSCGSLPPSEHELLWSAGFTALMVLAWWTLCHLASRMVSQQVSKNSVDAMDGARIIEVQLGMFRWLSLALVVLCLAGFGLARNLAETAVLGESRALQSVVLLTPGYLLVLGIWSADFSYGVRLGYVTGGWRNRLRDLWQTFRSTLSWLTFPILGVLAVVDLWEHTPWGKSDTAGPLAELAFFVLIIAIVMFGLPIIIRRLFPTMPLDEDTGRWAGALLQSAGVRHARSLVWNTGGQSHNAMVAGFIGQFRTLLITDRLLRELPRDQIAMVILHEAAHLRRYHMPLRIAVLMPAWAIGLAITHVTAESTWPWLQTWSGLLGSVATIAATLLALRWSSYRAEFDADAHACRLSVVASESVEHVPNTLDLAAETLSTALLRVTAGQPESQAASWLHPSVADRVTRLRNIAVQTPAAATV